MSLLWEYTMRYTESPAGPVPLAGVPSFSLHDMDLLRSIRDCLSIADAENRFGIFLASGPHHAFTGQLVAEDFPRIGAPGVLRPVPPDALRSGLETHWIFGNGHLVPTRICRLNYRD